MKIATKKEVYFEDVPVGAWFYNDGYYLKINNYDLFEAKTDKLCKFTLNTPVTICNATQPEEAIAFSDLAIGRYFWYQCKRYLKISHLISFDLNHRCIESKICSTDIVLPIEFTTTLEKA